MSNSAIFQLYSDGTVGQFSNLDMLRGTHAMDNKGLLRAKPTLALGRPKKALTSLPSEGPQAVRVRRELNLDPSIHNQAYYLYATMAGNKKCEY